MSDFNIDKYHDDFFTKFNFHLSHGKSITGEPKRSFAGVILPKSLTGFFCS